MFRKSFLVKSVCVLCVLVAVMILVSGCGTNAPIGSTTIPAPAPTPPTPATPTPISNLSVEVEEFLRQHGFTWTGKILPAGLKPWTYLNPCRRCTGRNSDDVIAQVEIKTPIYAIARFCRESGYQTGCDELELEKAEGQWKIISKKWVGYEACKCPEPT